MRTIAVIPARGGSKRIPGKNIRPFCGKPIIAYSVEAAQRSGLFDRIIVSTDSMAIADVARKCGAEVPFLRPADLADDVTGTDEVFLHAIGALQTETDPIETACCLYATAPFVQPRFLREGFDALMRSNAITAFSVTGFEYPAFRALLINSQQRLEMIWPEYMNSRSQELPPTYHDAGQFYWANVRKYAIGKRLFSVDAVPVLLPHWLVQDIDSEADWVRAEHMFQALRLSGEIEP